MKNYEWILDKIASIVETSDSAAQALSDMLVSEFPKEFYFKTNSGAKGFCNTCKNAKSDFSCDEDAGCPDHIAWLRSEAVFWEGGETL